MADRLTRRQALGRFGSLLAGGTAALALPGRGGRTRGSRPPNIVFILADDLGYGNLGCYGQPRIRTPHLDAMAAGGMRFSDCYASSPVCRPSRCSLLTGLHTGHTRIRRNEPITLDPSDYTVAEMLREAGYATGAIGKWQLGGPNSPGTPGLAGFDHFYGYLVGSQEYYPPRLWHNDRSVFIAGNQDGRREVYAPDLLQSQALMYVRRHAHQPFFLYLAHNLPHASNTRWRLTGNGMDVPTEAPYQNRPWPETERCFAAMVTRLDRCVGRLLGVLREEGLERDTIVFFSSDNGPHAEGGHDPGFFDDNGPLRGIKGSMYEGGLRVPMIAYWPGAIPAGAVSDQLWAFWDFMPTAAELAGAAAPPNTDGVSVVPALLGSGPCDRPPLYWEGYGTTAAMEQAVRIGSWKGVRRASVADIELYDLTEDIGEASDVAGHHPDIVAQVGWVMQAAHVGVPPRLAWSKRAGYEQDGVEPDSGAANSTPFRFEMQVADLDGGEPEWVRIAIRRDGEDWRTVDMAPGGAASPRGRKYHHVRKLPPGNYHYRFSAADADGEGFLPRGGFRLGPIVETHPYLTWTGEPGFEEDGVEPKGGDGGSILFEFRVLYRAHDADRPEGDVRLTLWRDGTQYRSWAMKLSPRTTDPVVGLIYYLKRFLPAGQYEYRFSAADRHGKARGVASRRTGGVVVPSAQAAISSLTATPTRTGGAQITLVLAAPAEVAVAVTNLAGRPVATVTVGKQLPRGTRTLVWNGTGATGLPVPAGTYLIQAVARAADGTVANGVATCPIRR